MKDNDYFTLIDLALKTAIYKGLANPWCDDISYLESKIINIAPTLDETLLAFLAARGINRKDRPDCHGEIFTLVDENRQEEIPGYRASNYWNFKPTDMGGGQKICRLAVTLSVRFSLNAEDRGFRLWPHVFGNFVSPVDRLPNFRMFKAMVEWLEKCKEGDALPAVAEEIVKSGGSIVVPWTDIGLGGIRSVSQLFTEIFGQNDLVKRIATRGEVFDPQPYPHIQTLGDELFIAEPAQPEVIRVWRAQLKEYQSKLNIKY